MNIPHHIRAKKVFNARSTHESYLKKGQGNYIYEKRKIIALIKKDINSPSPEKKSDKSLIDVKKFTKKIKTIH